jgi:thiamine pyrophosphate-dependent acetolactate synthase large subunit-like protein
MSSRASDLIVRQLVDQGVTAVFGIPGIHTLGLYDALAAEPRIRHVTMRHESGAAFAADGYARAGGGIGVVTATTGPGTFNTLGALSEADLDGSRVLLLAGQVPVAALGRGYGVLHETDDQGAAFAPACGFIGRPRTADELVSCVASALESLARPGARPAYVEMPADLLDVPAQLPGEVPAVADSAPPVEEVARAAELATSSSLVVILAGPGVVVARARAELTALAERLAAPVLVAAAGADAFDAGHPLSAGTLVPPIGGSAALLADADLVIVVGDRLDEQTTAGRTLRLGRRLVHLVDRPAHLAGPYSADVGIVGSLGASLRALVDELGPGQPDDARVAEAHSTAASVRDSLRAQVKPEAKRIVEAFDAIRRSAPPETIITSDAAAVNSYSAWFWPPGGEGTYLFPWGSAALGFALPAGIGASVARPDSPVLAVCGDGGFLFTIQELGSAAQIGANVTVLVADDGGYGSIAAYQRRRYERTLATELRNPDFVAIAQAHGIPGICVPRFEDLPEAVGSSLARGGPSVIQLTDRVPLPW